MKRVIRDLKSPNPQRRIQAVSELAKLGLTALQHLEKTLTDVDRDVRRQVFGGLLALGWSPKTGEQRVWRALTGQPQEDLQRLEQEDADVMAASVGPLTTIVTSGASEASHALVLLECVLGRFLKTVSESDLQIISHFESSEEEMETEQAIPGMGWGWTEIVRECRAHPHPLAQLAGEELRRRIALNR
jgi:hypothetical protein